MVGLASLLSVRGLHPVFVKDDYTFVVNVKSEFLNCNVGHFK